MTGKLLARGWRFAIDRGGTFTDVVAWDPAGRLLTHKVLSRDPAHAGDPAVRAIEEVLATHGSTGASVESVRLGTTVATNALLERKGEHANTLDMKHRGIVPIVDLARVYALSAGLPQINTKERLRAAAEAGALSKEGAANLEDALEFINMLRITHQTRQIKEGLPPDNHISPKELSPLERRYLKDAFGVISALQESLGNRYQAGRFS